MNTLDFESRIHSTKIRLWSAWTNSKYVTSWFAPEAIIEPKVGGAYELFFDPSDSRLITTTGGRFLELLPFDRFSFTWKIQDNDTDLKDEEPPTIVNVSLTEAESDVIVKVTHSGWGVGKEWDSAKEWHQLAWKQVLSSLKDFLESDN